MEHHNRNADQHGAEGRGAEFRVESSKPAWGAFWPKPGAREVTLTDRSLAVAVAAKAHTNGAIQVVHVTSGEVIFRKENAAERPCS